MIHTPQIEKAIQKASILHQHQKRKAEVDLPYITHLFSVALIVAEYTHDEDTIIAGLLHDTLEDTEYTAEELEKDFGTRIKDIVLDVTEKRGSVKSTTPEEKLRAWKKRKDDYLAHLATASSEGILVSYADKLHNLQSLINDVSAQGSDIWKKFAGSPEEQLWFFESVFEIFKKRLGSELVERYGEVYDEAKVLFLK